MQILSISFLFLSIFYHATSQVVDFASVKQKITSTGLINENSIGHRLFNSLNASLHSAEAIQVSNCNFQITGTASMQCQCLSTIWKSQVSATFIIWVTGANKFISAEFVSLLSGTDLMTKLVGSVPKSFSQIAAQDKFSVSYASGEGSPHGTHSGITVSVKALMSPNSVIFQQIQKIVVTKPSDSLIATFHVTPDQTDASLAISRVGNFPITTLLTVTKVEVTASGAGYLADVQFFAKVKSPAPPGYELLYLTASGQIPSGQEGLVLSGKLMTPWIHPLGFKWINSIDSATFTYTLEHHNEALKLTLAAVSQITFSKDPVNLLIQIGGPDAHDVLFAIQNINVDKKVDEVYTLFTGKSHASLSQVNIHGVGAIAASTYDSPNFKQGLTFQITATVTQGVMLDAAKKFSPTQAESFVYLFTCHIPFGTLSAQITLVETTPFVYSKKITFDNYQYILDIGGGTKIEVQANIGVLTKDLQVVKVDVSATLAVGSGLTFLGTTTSNWNHPFGLKWINDLYSGASVSLQISPPVYFKMHGVANLSWYPNSQAQFDLQLGGQDFEENVIALQNIPILDATLDKIISHMTGKSFAVVKDLNAKGTYGVVAATFDSPFGGKGLTLKAHVQVTEHYDTTVYKAISLFRSNPSDIVYDISFYMPWDNPIHVHFDLSEAGKFPLNKRVSITDWALHVWIGEKVEIDCGMDVTFSNKGQPMVLHFATMALFNIQDPSVTFSGEMTGQWANPFGVKWLTITDIKIVLSLGYQTILKEFSLSGTGNYVWNPQNHGTASVTLRCADNFADDSIEFTINNLNEIHTIVNSIAGNGVSNYISEISVTHQLAVDFILSTSSGITLQLDASVTGHLADTFHKHLYLFPQQPGTSYHLFVNIPLFSSNPLAITLGYSETENKQVSKHLWLQGYTFSLNILEEKISLDGKAIGKWNNNPDLTFYVSGSFDASAGIVLMGAMMGTWENAFGKKGFNLSDCVVKIGFSPSACTFGCISVLGLASTFTVGQSTTVSFAGQLMNPEFYNIYLAGSIKKSVIPKSLPMTDVINSWNGENPTKPVSKNNIPANWAMTGVSFYLAGADGDLGPIHYKKGFGITATFRLLQSMDVIISLNCSGDSYTCDWAFNAPLTVSEVEKLILHEIKGAYPDKYHSDNNETFTFFKLHDVKIDKWSQQNVANGQNPNWNYDMVILNKNTNHHFDTDQYWMSNSFHDYFSQHLKHLF